MSEGKSKNIYLTSNTQPPRATKLKNRMRVEVVYQDLDQAIRQMRNSIKNKQKMSQAKDHHQTNPEKKQEGLTATDELFYTQTYKKKVEARLSEIEIRKKELNALSLEKQMRARLLRKIEENTELQQKMDILKEVQQRRQLLLLEKSERDRRKKEEEQMLHQSSLMNAEMMRRSRKKSLKNSLKESRCELMESLKDLKFKNYLSEKSKQEKQMLLNSRLQFMVRNKSVPGLRGQLATSQSSRNSNVSLHRALKSSQVGRALQKSQKMETNEDAIIKQYTNKQSGREGAELVWQKKYNTTARRREISENEQNPNPNPQPETVDNPNENDLEEAGLDSKPS